jgi:hypothetical protein
MLLKCKQQGKALSKQDNQKCDIHNVIVVIRVLVYGFGGIDDCFCFADSYSIGIVCWSDVAVCGT